MNQELSVIFYLEGEEYAIPVTYVKEIIWRQKIGRPPADSYCLAGSVNSGDKIIPVISLAAKFGLAPKYRKQGWIILVEIGMREFGIIVDEVTEVQNLPVAVVDMVSGDSPQRASWLRGIGKIGKRLISFLDLPEIFSLTDFTVA